MSWKVTAWAEKQRTGSASRKVLLLVLANYADEDGICWPSQETLASGTELSVDTIQRQLKRLEANGVISRWKRPARLGRWPGHAYRLNMFAAASPEPQNAARPTSDPGKMRSGNTASEPKSEPQAMRHDPSTETSPERIRTVVGKSDHPHPERPLKGAVDKKVGRSSRPTADGSEIVQNILAKRLGLGDIAVGWALLGWLSDLERDALTEQQRSGLLSEDTLLKLRLRYKAEHGLSE